MAIVGKILFDADDKIKDFFTNNVVTKNKIEAKPDIVYYDKEPDTCVLDIYYPTNKKNKMPVLLNIHGGGWITGDKYWRRGLSKIYADMGMFVITPNYGISPKHKYHEAVQHIYAVIKWIYDNAETFDLDLDNAFITGDSAGGQLACLVLATQNNADFKSMIKAQDCPLKFRSGILCCGAYDIDKIVANPLAEPILKDMTGLNRSQIKDYEYYKAIRTIDWIDTNFPSNVFVVYGRYDLIVGDSEKTLIEKLEKLGIKHFVYGARGLGDHCFHLWYKRRISKIFYQACEQYFQQMLDPNIKDINLKLPK